MVGEAGGHLQGRPVHAAALLLGGVDDAADRVGGLGVAVGAEDVHGLVVRRPGEPGVDLGDRAGVQGRGEEEAGEEVLSGWVEVGVRLGVGAAGT